MPDLIRFITASPLALILLVTILAYSLAAFRDQRRYLNAILHPYSVFERHEFRRLALSCFVHNDGVHLIINTIMFLLICTRLEKQLSLNSAYGSLIFMITFLMSHMAGGIAVTLSHRRDSEYLTAGASGGILGCMMCLMVIAPKHIFITLPFNISISNQFMALIIIAALISSRVRPGAGQPDNELHFYSAVCGTAIGLICHATN